jgi:pyrimidine-nucleoside phosphorylase
VKFGSGAFMKTRTEATQLAESMTAVGKRMGVKMSHLLNPMDEPIGRTVGNALEVAECVDILEGGGPSDLVKLILDLAEKVSDTPRAQLQRRLRDGSAWKRFVALVYAQDGDATALERMLEVHTAPVIRPLPAKTAGTVRKMDAALIGRASVLLGAGRQKAGDAIDFAVGMSAIKKTGEKVDKAEPLMFVHARSKSDFDSVLPLLRKATEID